MRLFPLSSPNKRMRKPSLSSTAVEDEQEEELESDASNSDLDSRPPLPAAAASAEPDVDVLEDDAERPLPKREKSSSSSFSVPFLPIICDEITQRKWTRTHFKVHARNDGKQATKKPTVFLSRVSSFP